MLLLHNLTPHIHGEELLNLAQTENSSDESLLDWLTDLFQTDLGEGHLECFSVEKDQLLDLDFSINDFQPDFFFFEKINPFQIDEFPIILLGSFHFEPPVLKDRSVQSTGLRGPPATA